MRIHVLTLSLVLVLTIPATASASLDDEQRQGQGLVAELQSSARTCGQLSPSDFDHVGEYVMARALGSTRFHQTMNDRMRLMLGEPGEQRMHELMGRQLTGCLAGSPAGAGAAMGPGRMGAASGNGGWDPMMRSGDWSWMMGGTWRSMSRQDWQRLQQHWLATSVNSTRSGWSAWVIAARALGAPLIGAPAVVVAQAAMRRSMRSPTAHTP